MNRYATPAQQAKASTQLNSFLASINFKFFSANRDERFEDAHISEGQLKRILGLAKQAGVRINEYHEIRQSTIEISDHDHVTIHQSRTPYNRFKIVRHTYLNSKHLEVVMTGAYNQC